jgi:CDP-diacylglycerol--glycerol-3-phosphate 3-phosphatidyltransferase
MLKKSYKALLPRWLKDTYLSLLDPIVLTANRLGIHPSTFTTIGFLIGLVSACFMAFGSFRLAGGLLLLSGMCDNIDGKLARISGKESKFGALYDSILDRYAEVFFFFGMAFYFIRMEWFLTSVAIAIALGGSLMVSYVRARAEALGFECSIGLIQRAERLVFLGLGAVIHLYTLVGVIWILAVLTNVTAIQRIHHVWRADIEKRPVEKPDVK